MEEEDSTLEHSNDVLLSVLNSKSIGNRFSRFSRNRSRLNRNERVGSSLSASALRPDGVGRPFRRLKIDHDDHPAIPSTTSTSSTSSSLSPPPSPILHYNHYPLSTSKLRKQHSISTPELHSKVMSGHQGQHGEVKPRAAREVDFSGHFEKENAHPGLLHSSTSSTSSTLQTLTSSSSLSHLHPIPPSSTPSVFSSTPSLVLSTSSSLRPPLRELPPPPHPPHRVEDPHGDSSSTSQPSHPLLLTRRRRMLGTWTTTASTSSTTTPTPSPLYNQPHSTLTPTPPPPSVVLHRSKPLFRSQHAFNRSNTASEVNSVLGRLQNRSNTASEVDGVLGRSQHMYSKSNTASEMDSILCRLQNRSNTASEVNTALARPQTGAPTATDTPMPCIATATHTHAHNTATDTPRPCIATATRTHAHNTATEPQQTRTHTNTASNTLQNGTHTATDPQQTRTHTNTASNTLQNGTHTATDPQQTRTHTNTASNTLQNGTHTATDPQQTRTHSNTASNTLQSRTHTATAPRTTHRAGEGEQANLRPPQDLPTAPQPPPPSSYFTVKGKKYLKLHLLGRGGSSKVFAVVDEESRQVRAMKVVNLQDLDEGTLTSYKNEITMLERLKDCSRVIRLFDHEVRGQQLVLVMEKGSEDFAAILSHARSKKGYTFPHYTIQHYWAGMLLAVQQIHQHGIIHCDLKPANFLLVDSMVKLIDFGIASSIQQDMTSVVKDSQAGTFNYMSPESLSLLEEHTGPIINTGAGGGRPAIKIRVKSDVWSLGCILYNFVYGRTPFQHITNPLKKLCAIANPNTRIDFPEIKNEHLMDVLRLCLQFDPHRRPSIEELLEHPLLTH